MWQRERESSVIDDAKMKKKKNPIYPCILAQYLFIYCSDTECIKSSHLFGDMILPKSLKERSWKVGG